MEGHFSGSCHCGKVAFEIDGPILNVVNCHCSICRKVNGGAFSTYLVVSDEVFKVKEGQDLLTRYAMTEKADKNFCKICGAPVFNRNKLYSGVTVVPLGCLDDAAKFAPKADIYCADMLPWVTLWPESKRYETGLQ